jgi:hypothetical protein
MQINQKCDNTCNVFSDQQWWYVSHGNRCCQWIKYIHEWSPLEHQWTDVEIHVPQNHPTILLYLHRCYCRCRYNVAVQIT